MLGRGAKDLNLCCVSPHAAWTECRGQEEIVDRHDNLTVARAIYRGRVSQYPSRLVMLRDRTRVLARSDRPETTP